MKKTTYSEAIEELGKIVAEIESEDISVDSLSAKVKRASELIRICKSVLYKTESEVNDILKELQEDETNPEA